MFRCKPLTYSFCLKGLTFMLLQVPAQRFYGGVERFIFGAEVLIGVQPAIPSLQESPDEPVEFLEVLVGCHHAACRKRSIPFRLSRRLRSRSSRSRSSIGMCFRRQASVASRISDSSS